MIEERGIRPSLWMAAVLFALGASYAVYATLSYSPAEARAEAERAERAAHRARSHRADPSHDPARPTRHASHARGDYQHHDWSQETTLQRSLALGLPPPGFWQAPIFDQPEQHDPQLVAMYRSFHYRRASPEDEPNLPFEPTAHRLNLTDAEGDVAGSASSCDVRVLPVSDANFNCLIRVTCDGEVLYPDSAQHAGYVHCELDDDGQIVRAVDSGHTAGDGDPLVDLNLEEGTIVVEDYDAEGDPRYRATLRVSS